MQNLQKLLKNDSGRAGFKIIFRFRYQGIFVSKNFVLADGYVHTFYDNFISLF